MTYIIHRLHASYTRDSSGFAYGCGAWGICCSAGAAGEQCRGKITDRTRSRLRSPPVKHQMRICWRDHICIAMAVEGDCGECLPSIG
jgi:hypothetical protein